MQTKTHPKWYPETKATCACGKSFTVGSTVPEINVEVCSACHPFYTGKMKFIDTAGRVDAFKTKQAKANKKLLSKTEKRKLKKLKRLKEDEARPDTLADVRKTAKKK